jgi:hypothetical protein
VRCSSGNRRPEQSRTMIELSRAARNLVMDESKFAIRQDSE